MERTHPLYLLIAILAAILLQWFLVKRLNRNLKQMEVKQRNPKD